jgi:predicted MFS family arabinose efflux permease
MVGSAMAGCGYSLVFPSIGMEVVRRVPVQNRGAALGIYTGFVDVSFFLTGPTTGAMIGWFGYSSVFVFAIVAVLLSLGLAFTLWNKVRHDAV